MEKTGSLSLETRTQYDRLSKMLANMRNNHIKEAEEYEESISTDPSYARRRSGERKMQEQQTIQDTLAALSHLPQYEEALTYVRQNASQSAQANFDSMVQDFLDTDDAAAAYRPSNWLQEPQNFEAIQNAMDQLNDLFHQDTQATICEHCKQSTEENMQHMAQLIANQGTSEIEQYVSDIAEGNAMAYPLRPDPSEILDEDEINAYNQRTAQAAQELMNDIREAGENTVELLTDQTNEDYAPELIQMSRRFEDLERRAQEINRTAQFT